MAATGNEVPLLSQLKLLKNWISEQLENKAPFSHTHQIATISYAGFVPNLPSGAVAASTYFRGDGSWAIPPDTTYNVATQLTDGLMSKEDKTKLDSLIPPTVDVVKVTSHQTSYTKDTLEVVCDSTGKVTAMYFVSV